MYPDRCPEAPQQRSRLAAEIDDDRDDEAHQDQDFHLAITPVRPGRGLE
jgi:hypothetical protein